MQEIKSEIFRKNGGRGCHGQTIGSMIRLELRVRQNCNRIYTGKEHLIYEKKDQVTAAEEQKEAVQVKGKKRRAREAQREIRWDRLDNTAHLFPVIAGESMSNVYRISVTLTELVDRELLQQALDMVLPKFVGLICGLRQGSVLVLILRKTASRHRVCGGKCVSGAAISGQK